VPFGRVLWEVRFFHPRPKLTLTKENESMKKLLALLLLGAALVFGGCTATTQDSIMKTTRVATDDIEKQDDGTIVFSGGIDEDSYKEFRALTLDGRDHYTLIILTNGGCGYNTVAIMNRIETLQKQGVKFTTYITGQAKFDSKIIKEERREYLLYMDEYVVNKFRERFPHIKEEWIKETFWNSGMTFMTAKTAKLMGIATRIVN